MGVLRRAVARHDTFVPDNGCKHHPSCLTCPFEVCLLEVEQRGKRKTAADLHLSLADATVEGKIVNQALNGSKAQAIALNLGLTIPAVNLVLRQSNFREQRDTEILRKHDDGLTVIEIAKLFNMQRTSIHRLIREANASGNRTA